MTLGIVTALTGVIALTASESPASSEQTWGPRDPWLRPFDADSIWNTPIGSDAEFVTSGYPAYEQGAGDAAQLVRTTASDPVVDVHQPYEWRDRCNTAATETGTMRLPHDFYVTDAELKSNGSWKTPNNNGVVLDPDGRTLRSIAMTCRDQLGGPLYAWTVHTDDIYGDGIDGAHGATQMSAYSGAIRDGELTGSDPIAHALDLIMYAETAYMEGTDTSTCYRWPASSCDAYAGSDGDHRYSGTNPEFRIGALLAIPQSTSCDSLALESAEGAKLCWTMQHYGGYWTDDSAWEANYIQVEEHTPDDDAFNRAEVRRDLGKVIAAAQIVANNAPDNIGGGGTPLAPRHVNEWATGMWGTEGVSTAPTTTTEPTMTGPDPATAPTGKSFADWFSRTWIGSDWVGPQISDWGLDGDRAYVTGSSGDTYMVRDGRTWVGTFEADVFPGPAASAGLVARWSDPDNHVAVTARRDPAGIELTASVMADGTRIELGHAVVGNVGRVGLSTWGTDVMVTVDGEVVIGARMSDAASGALGEGHLFGMHVERSTDAGSTFDRTSYTPTVQNFTAAGDTH